MVEISFLTIKTEFFACFKIYNGIQLIQRIANYYEITTGIKLANFLMVIQNMLIERLIHLSNGRLPLDNI